MAAGKSEQRQGEKPSVAQMARQVKRGDDPIWVRFAFAAVTGLASGFPGDPERVVRIACDLADRMCKEAEKPL